MLTVRCFFRLNIFKFFKIKFSFIKLLKKIILDGNEKINYWCFITPKTYQKQNIQLLYLSINVSYLIYYKKKLLDKP